MKWPEFNSTIGVAASNDVYQLVASEKICKPLLASSVSAQILISDKDNLPLDGFMFSPASMTLFLSPKFIGDHFLKKSQGYNDFTAAIRNVYDMFSGIFSGEEAGTLRSSTFSFCWRDDQNNILIFSLQNNTVDELAQRTSDIFDTIGKLSTNSQPVLGASIAKTYSASDQVKYLGFVKGEIIAIDPLAEMAEATNTKYKLETDDRASKPHIIFHRENLNKKFNFGDQWVLRFDGLATLMARPNDVSIYSNICRHNLMAARKFYEEVIRPRHKYYSGNFPSIERQREYFDYFELITSAIIFSFTSIEALVNMLIPENYVYTTTENTKHDKAYIEFKYSLSKKMKKTLRDILATSDPLLEEWWADFEDLQELRNQTIHTKQAISEHRYSKLLEEDIFRIIDVHKIIINYYGKYILQNAPEMLNIFPYNFGYDQITPSLMSDKTYHQIYNDLHNPSAPF